VRFQAPGPSNIRRICSASGPNRSRSRAEIDLRPEGEATFTWEEHGSTHGRVEQIEPPHFVSFRWMRAVGERAVGTEVRQGNSTLVEFRLTAEGDGTRLHVVESGFPQLEGLADETARIAEDHERGWDRELGELRDYVSKTRASARR
jgi:uncharacterized protein YndB with AHSA1/START domain